MSRRSWGALITGLALLAVTACGPDPAPATPTWVTTHVSRSTGTNSTTNYVGAWTSGSWAATVEIVTTTPSGGTATVQVFGRSGPGGSVLGAPQLLPLAVIPSVIGPLGGEQVFGVPGTFNGSPAVEFFEPGPSGWSSTGVVTVPAGQTVAAIGDRWLVTRTVPTSPGTDAHVVTWPLDLSGPTAVVGAPQTLDPDPSWAAALREGFGGPGVSIDGDLMVVGGQGQFAPTPGGARVFRATAGVWAPVLSLGATSTGPNGFGRALAVDDGATVDRIALGPQSDTAPVIDVYADNGSGFVLEQTLVPDPSDPDVYQGLLFGASVAIDGDLLALSSRGVLVPSPDPGHPDVKVGYVALYRKAVTWTREAEVPTFTTPAPSATISSLPFRLQMSGNHVAAFLFVSPDPPPNCVFPCFNFGFEAWSIDRTG